MPEMWVDDSTIKTVGVTIVKENSKGERQLIQIWGKEAEKWGEAIDAQASFCYAHGIKFPQLEWEVY